MGERDRIRSLETQLRQALAECERLRKENERFRSRAANRPPDTSHEPLRAEAAAQVHRLSPASEKIALFRSLFRGRDDTYALRWASRKGRAGYSPACGNEWHPSLCGKPEGKCARCPNRELLPLTDGVIREHLRGRKTVGIYPLLSDETCWFLAVDFDKGGWREDAVAFLNACRENNVPAALERSRSGNGAHAWIFFSEPVPARLARQLGSALLTLAMERRYEIGLDSYDRLFPNQDTLPKGGFGNLIALPLQGEARREGNSVFVDETFTPYPDQWAFLSAVPRLTGAAAERVVHSLASDGHVLRVRHVDGEPELREPWRLPPSGTSENRPIPGPFPEAVRVVQGDLAYIEKNGLPPGLLNRLVRIAAFQNPEFYRAQAMRLSTFGKPRVIHCAEDFPEHVGLPRGCLDEAICLLEAHGIAVHLVDERHGGTPLDVTFRGQLQDLQAEAARALLAYDTGILCATTAFGKTVVAAWLIAARAVSTLVLVHRTQLLEQWRERLSAFLGVSLKAIGQIGGAKNRPTGLLDVATLQSLHRKGRVKDLVAEYGHVIVDESHHVPAFGFEQVLRKVKARYVLGLTATPTRKDGHHPILTMQCGPVRFSVEPKKAAAARPFSHEVIPRWTSFVVDPQTTLAGIQALYSALARDPSRNELILKDVLESLGQGRSPLVLTERLDHLDLLAHRLEESGARLLVFRGGLGRRERRRFAEEMRSIPSSEPRAIVATGRSIGEGFDDARLDTLFLALPIAWRGTLQQYAGRLHRVHAGKRVVRIYDYVDAEVPVLLRMYHKRVRGYRAMGYEFREEGLNGPASR